MEIFKRLLIAAFAPAAQRWALIEGNPHAPIGGAQISIRSRRGKRIRARAIWQLAAAH